MGSCCAGAVLETEQQLERRESGIFQMIYTKVYNTEGQAVMLCYSSSDKKCSPTLHLHKIPLHWSRTGCVVLDVSGQSSAVNVVAL